MRKKSLVRPAIVLSIAGSDCGGGAGIQADLKSISANGGYAVTAITAVTAQNTRGVQNIVPLPTKLVEEQLHSIFEDFRVDSVKIGMLHNIEIVKIVAEFLQRYNPKFVVLDPVIVSSAGNILTEKDAISVMVDRLFPYCTLVTPNIDETISIITSSGSCSLENKRLVAEVKNSNLFDFIKESALEIFKLGAKNVLITGVDRAGFKNCSETTILKNDNFFDLLFSDNQYCFFGKEKVLTKNTHGTGCSLSSSIATNLALGQNITNAVVLSQKYVHECILSAKNIEIGHGNGPINHFFSPNSLKLLN
jgi:hydroxymethylpyrimidine/phosphomethylpyrimidine kinase